MQVNRCNRCLLTLRHQQIQKHDLIKQTRNNHLYYSHGEEGDDASFAHSLEGIDNSIILAGIETLFHAASNQDLMKGQSITHDMLSMYKTLSQWTRKMYQDFKHLNMKPDKYSTSMQLVTNHCKSAQISNNHIQKPYDLVIKYELSVLVNSPLNESFIRPLRFCIYIDGINRWSVGKESYMLLSMENNLDINSTSNYCCSMELLRNKIAQHGVIYSLILQISENEAIGKTVLMAMAN